MFEGSCCIADGHADELNTITRTISIFSHVGDSAKGNSDMVK
jgi:hypothetical protein